MLRRAALSFVVAVTMGVACFSPTAVRVVVSTSVPCERGLDTMVFVGERGKLDLGDPVSQTADCSASGIGSLTVVPSGSRTAGFSVAVVAGVGIPASRCAETGYAQCIVARRSVSFREHESFDLNVLLSDRCIGVACGADETCDTGSCRPVDQCANDGCPSEVVDAGPPDAGGGAGDASVDGDAAPPAVLGACSSTIETVVDGQAIVGPLAMQGGDFVYANVSVGASEVRRVSRRGGAPVRVENVPGVRLVAASETSLAWSSVVGSGMRTTVMRGGVPTTVPIDDGSPNSLAFFRAEDAVGFVQQAASAKAFTLTPMLSLDTAAFPGPVPEIVLDDRSPPHAYGVGGGATVVHYNLAARTLSFVSYISGQSPSPDIAMRGRALFVALSAPGREGIHRILGDDVTPSYAAPPWLAGVIPRSMAAGESLYYVTGTTLYRLNDGTSAGIPISIGSVSADADRLIVDADCVYWVEGGTRIRRRAR